MSRIVVLDPASNYRTITVKVDKGMLDFLSRKGYTVVSSIPVN